MGEGRDARGQLANGHAPIPGGHRPKGAVNIITRSLREKVMDGFGEEDGVTEFVKELKKEYPPAAAGLLARMMPPAEAGDASTGVFVTQINKVIIPRGMWLTAEQARELANTDEERGEYDRLIEHQRHQHQLPSSPPVSSSPPALRVIENSDENFDATEEVKTTTSWSFRGMRRRRRCWRSWRSSPSRSSSAGLQMKKIKGELLQRFLDRGRRSAADDPVPATEAKPKPGSQEWYRNLPEPVDTGITMNELARSIPKPRPPRAPGMQGVITTRWRS